jgi:hypothetical protein
MASLLGCLLIVTWAASATALAVFHLWVGRKRKYDPIVAPCFWCFTAVVAFGAAGVFLGIRKHEKDAETARAFVTALEPRLRAYFDEHGQFPETLDVFLVRIPIVDHREMYYSGYGDSFEFLYPEPTNLVKRWEYNSGTKTWRLN